MVGKLAEGKIIARTKGNLEGTHAPEQTPAQCENAKARNGKARPQKEDGLYCGCLRWTG
jgi:hypothetical protein